MMGAKNKNLITLLTESKETSQKAIAVYRSLGPVFLMHELKKRELDEAFKKANILSVGLSLNINQEFIDQMPNLKVIATQTTGLNHIDTDYASRKGIKVISLRGHTDFLQTITSTAEHAWGMTLALARNIPHAFLHVKNGGWDRMLWRGHELKGKTLGILGLGRLGRMMAKYGAAFGMDVLASDPYVSRSAMRGFGAKKADMDFLLKNSDVVTLHVLLTDETRNLLKEKHLRLMRPSAYLVNTARAELIEKGALYKALKNRWIAGAAIDVMWDEKPDGGHLKGDPLWRYAKTHTNLIISPHIGGAAYEAMHKTQDFIAELTSKHVKES